MFSISIREPSFKFYQHIIPNFVWIVNSYKTFFGNYFINMLTNQLLTGFMLGCNAPAAHKRIETGCFDAVLYILDNMRYNH